MNKEGMISDIIAEMREGMIPRHRHDRELLHHYADRLEAARKRESGDCAQLRKALERLREWAALDLNENAYIDQKSGNHLKLIKGVLEIANAALAAPPRNCDVGDAADWEKRFGEECDKGHICSDCPVRHEKTRMAIELDKGARCEFIWGQMPYEEGGAK